MSGLHERLSIYAYQDHGRKGWSWWCECGASEASLGDIAIAGDHLRVHVQENASDSPLLDVNVEAGLAALDGPLGNALDRLR